MFCYRTHDRVNGPAMIKALEFLKLAAERYNDGGSANDASWLIFSNEMFFDIDEALRLAKLAASSENPHIQATAHNNIGVYYHYSDRPNNLEMAREHFHKSAELFSSQDYIWEIPYENLARLYLFNLPDIRANVVEAKHWAQIADENEGNGFFTYLLAKYPFGNDTTIEQALTWLEKEAQRQNSPAFMELAFIHEILRNDEDIVKWYTLCSLMCATEDGRLRAEKELIKKKKSTKGVVFAKGKSSASDWLSTSLIAVSSNVPASDANEATNVEQKGQLYAFLVGINRYQKYENLETPLRDIYSIGEVLEKKFAARNIFLENATRREITTELNQLRKVLTRDDSVLIYYAGHGWLDLVTDEGYCLPSDATDDDTNWVSNNYVLNKLKAFPATNVMLVADSCFSGSIISRGVSIPTVNDPKTVLQKYLDTPSRIAITSGGLKPVLDGGGNGNSLFAAAFAEALEKANQPITSAEIYLNVRDNVTKKSLALNIDQTPLRGELTKAGHEGPDFILIPR